MKNRLIYLLPFLFLFFACTKERSAYPENVMEALINDEYWSGASSAEWQKYQDVLVIQGVRCLSDQTPCFDSEDLTIAIHGFIGQTGVYDIESPSYGLYRNWFGGDMTHFCGQTDSTSFTGQISLTVFDTLFKTVECTFHYKAKDEADRIYMINSGRFYSNQLAIFEQ
ncbi:MAG: hypothetical protein IPJ82_02390 [Lewinellaceae bacterium]|nr:hypothetical protein [Lewinellaceae bacterium]